ncbi:hypothetical protein Q4561_12670 [Alteromonas sp. 1_MG-2023]|uniref:hypothetical protein n=1 Tax=Alteromonas sp. 1_MG-2023 TaxID=3062669 RepID=UPI0026E37342|nr:hypothetical protein [Alteromonas sp. 1_MG-2023]MDO6567917.1 hypothetical protein [Alteromonas sp. 1_MG-2023]
MPRAVIIAVGDLSLNPIEALAEKHNIRCTSIQALDVNNITSIDNLVGDTEEVKGASAITDCLLVQTQQGAFKQATAFKDIETLLVYSLPETYLSQHLAAKHTEKSVHALLQTWQEDMQGALHTAEQSTNIKLCSLNDILDNPRAFFSDVFNENIDCSSIPLDSDIVQKAEVLSASAWLVDKDELYELYDDALSIGTLYGEFVVHLSPEADTFKSGAKTLCELTLKMRATLTKVAKLEKQITGCNSTLAAKSAEQETIKITLGELTQQLNEEKERYRETSNQIEKLKLQNVDVEKANTQLHTELVTEREKLSAIELRSAELNEKLSTAVKKANRLQQVESALKSSLEQVTALEKQLINASDDDQLTKAQIVQLQEELEFTADKANKLEQAEANAKAFSIKNTELEKQLATANDDAQLFQLQITQLQEELEGTFKQLQAVKNNESNYQKNTEALAHLNKSAIEMTDVNAILTTQLSQLQNEVEQTDAEKAKLRTELDSVLTQQGKQQQAMLESEKKSQNADVELELASLQITQLQEELEHYYLALQESERSLKKGLTHSTMNTNKIQTKVFDKVTAQGISVTGQYSEGDYKDIHLCLHNVMLPTGNMIESIHAKLIIVSGHVGIEFRAEDNERLFREHEDAADAYGPYLRYFLTAPEGAQTQQQKTVERMNASERLLIMGCINAIALQLQNNNIETAVNVMPDSWREWRKASLAFVQHVDNLPNWLSFDSVHLREEYVTDGYEHLWLVFSGVLLGNVWRNSLELKLSANAIGSANNGEFSEALNLEFRELDDGSAPLMAWPPENVDDYGPKLSVAVDNLAMLSKLADQDVNLIEHLVNNFPSILEKLELEGHELAHSKDAWGSAITALLSVTAKSTIHPEEIDTVSQNEITENMPDITLVTCEEVISVGNYQHLVFTQKGNNTKIKLRAEDVNPDTFDAEMYVELRDGTSDVIYRDSEFFGEDGYGPRVLIPLEHIISQQKLNEGNEFVWATQAFAAIACYLNESNELDDIVNRLWLNLIARKQK